uniref:uncharacterized protein LOC122599358 isoform X2 n=1 Tax=Erigeron canadensis TaxID=72917 RepID=UPI001CB8C1F6|nr:uncharacterized protein LOC122599358 isoform X2 [Erigeron canadensis]
MDVANSPESDEPAIEFPVSDGAPLTVPPWLRRRLTELNAYNFPSSIEEIEAKLQNADLRRQKFYENLSSKAQLKRRSFKAADDRNLAQRLEAKLQAAEQKRIQILKAHSQRRATLREKTSQSLLRTISFRGKYNQKHATAEKNWLELVEAEKKREHDRCLQVKKEAKPASQAKRQRADHLLQNVSLHNVVGVNCNMKTQRQADNLSKKLLRCWRKFIKQRTTLNLAKSYYVLNINASHGKSMPFEHFAFLIDKSSTLQTTKALLDRLETRYKALLDVTSGKNLDDISHLLTRVVSPNNRHVKVVSPRAITKTSVRLSRYQPRVVLSAYMVLDHPDTVFSGQGVRETVLVDSAKKFIQEFELLVCIILNGPSKTSGEGSNPSLARHCTFRSQLAAFDAAWCSYLNSFVIWKVKDVESLEQDLVKAACQMEISMIRRYKPAPNQADSALTHDMKALQKQIQVTEHQKLLEEKVMHLSGEAGIERLQDALSETRKQYFKSKENSMLAISPVTKPPSCLATSPFIAALHDESNSVVTSQFGDDASAPPFEHLGSSVASTSGLVNHSGERLGMENVLIVNEFFHGWHYSVADGSNISDENQKVRGTMEKAFWDGISESIQQENYDHVVVLMKEVRDELFEMSSKSGKQEILEAIDLDILSQLLGSRRLDMQYLGTIMEFALVRLQNLSAVAHENQLKVSYQKTMAELVELCHAGDGSNRSLAIALIKGLRFVLEQIQVLKQEISMARIKILEPLLKGPSGLEYLGKAFTKLYGPPSDALRQLPLTMQWLSFAGPSKDQEWSEHKRMLLELEEDSSLESR